MPQTAQASSAWVSTACLAGVVSPPQAYTNAGKTDASSRRNATRKRITRTSSDFLATEREHRERERQHPPGQRHRVEQQRRIGVLAGQIGRASCRERV